MAISMCFLLYSGVNVCVHAGVHIHLFFPVSLWARQELQMDRQRPAEANAQIFLDCCCCEELL